MKANQFQRILALLLAAALTVCLLPAAVFAAEEANSAPTEAAQSATDPPAESTEPTEISGDPTESTAPPVTEPEETIPPETAPEDTTPPEETEPTDPEETDWALHIGDALTPYGAVMPLTLDPGTVLTITDEIVWYCGNTSYDWHSEEYGKYGTFWTETAVYFRLSDGRIGFCTQPQKKGVTGDYTPSGWYKWIDSKAQQGIALILTYGSPNNGDTSEEGIKATALAVWDMALGYRYADGSLRGYGTPPFYRNCGGEIREKYDAILEKLARHGTIPSFTAKLKSQIGDAQTITLKRDAASGLYTGSAVDTNGVLADFNFISTIPGLTFTKSGNTLLVEATEEAAGKLSAGVTIKNRGSEAEVGPDSCTILSSVDYGTDKQLVVVLDEPTGPAPCYFKLEAENPAVKLTLRKSIDASPECIAQLQGNAMYSLAGAQYTISLNGVVQETLTTNANGEATSNKSYNVGDRLTYQEVVAPPGFKLDKTVYSYTVKSGENVISVTDVPVLDPPFAITKVDKQTTDPQGNASFSGAIFKWEYFDNDSWSGTPKRTWHFKTDANGRAQYDPSYLASGYTSSALYVNASGRYEIPLGTVKITEVVNSLGYIVLPQSLYCSIVPSPSTDSGADLVWKTESLQHIVNMVTGNFGVYEPIDESLFGSITFEKRDSVLDGQAQGGATLAGARYQIINWSTGPVQVGTHAIAQPGEVCYAFTTDPNGKFASGRIFPLGSYEIREVDPSTGYLVNSGWSVKFTVTADNQDFAFTGDSGCPESVIRGGVKIIKEDSLLGSSTGADAPLDGITFSLVNDNPNPVVVYGETYQPGETVLTLPIAWDGKQWSASTPADALPYGDYTLRENPAASDPTLANHYYFLNPDGQAIQIRENGVVITKTFKNEIRPGKISIEKVNLQGQHLAGAKFLLEWSTDGSAWQPVTASSTITPGSCTSASLTDGCLTTGTDGIITFEGLYPDCRYRLTELEAPDGYLLLADTAWEGSLPVEDLTVTLTVHNSPGYTLPDTGSTAGRLLPFMGLLLFTLALCLGILGINGKAVDIKYFFERKKKQ